MADQQPSQNPGVTTNTFSKGMLKDYNETFIGEGLYTHARNAVNNSHDGQVGVIGNEPSNLKCATIPYDVIGCIHLMDDQWFILSTDDVHSYVGIFDESACTYSPLKNNNPPSNFIYIMIPELSYNKSFSSWDFLLPSSTILFNHNGSDLEKSLLTTSSG